MVVEYASRYSQVTQASQEPSKKKVHFIAVTLNNDKKMQLTKILCEHEPFLYPWQSYL